MVATQTPEPVEINDAVNNPWSEESADNWSPPGTKYINGELVLIRDGES